MNTENGSLRGDPRDRALARLEGLPPGERAEMRRILEKNPQRFVRRLFEGVSPDLAALVLDQIDELAKFAATVRTPDDPLYKGMTQARAERDVRIHNKQVIQARKLLWQMLDKILSHVIGHPVQQHEVRPTEELTGTARALTEFGAEFLTELRELLAEEARSQHRLLEDGEFEILDEGDNGRSS